MNELTATARAMVAPGKGILAVDESVGTCTKRFEAAGIPSTPESRGAYRDMMFRTAGLGEYVSSAILFDETIRQVALDGSQLVHVLTSAGIIPGIKVDGGTRALGSLSEETITQGLEGLPQRLEEYRAMGARFTKWRAVIHIDAVLPTAACVDANADALGRYAAMAQAAGLVPIVEPEVLMDGTHDIDRCRVVTSSVLSAVFDHLEKNNVALDGIVLKPNMVVPGKKAADQSSPGEIARRTVETLREFVPPAVPGIAFLSGGQNGIEACANLNEMVRLGEAPWALTYSFGRALQYPGLEIWAGDPVNAPAAQAALLHRARMSSLASQGEWTPAAENEPLR
jgi:fructose-bisphosphate aldolase class I